MRENLDRAHEMVMNRTKLRRKVVGAMIYPASVVFITLALVTLLLVVVVPRFEEIYAQLGSQLPFFTRVVVGMSSYVPYLLALIAAMVAFTFAAIRKGRSDDHVAGRIDTIKSRIPLVGNLIVKSSIARIAGTMAGLHSSGVNLLTALDHARAVAGLRAHAKAIDQVREAVADGASVAAAMAQTQAFPDMFVQYIGVGEESGTLGEMLERYSESANEEVEETAGNIVRLIEPAMMVVIGAVIGFFLLALYLPILSIGNQIQ
jgi:type IV pilus assembly protein PilC